MSSGQGRSWNWVPLASVTEKIGSGATPAGGKDSYKVSGVALIRSLNVHDLEFRYENLARLDDVQAKQLSNVTVEGGDVLLNITGASIARCAVVPNEVLPARVNQHVSILRPFKQTLDSSFLAYFLVSGEAKNALLGIGSSAGSTRQALTKALLEEFLVPAPPIDEQKRIVAALDQAFAALDRARAKAEENLSDARLVFEAHLRALFSAREGKAWSTAWLGDLADFRNGINFTKTSRGKQVRVLGVKDFQNHFHAPDSGLDRVTIDGDLDPSDCLQSGDIVFVRSNGNPELIGRSLVVERMSERTAHSGFTIRARLRDSEIVPRFLGHFLKSSAVRRQMVDGGTGTNIKSLNQGTLSRIVVPLPSRAEQMRIVENLEAVREGTSRVEARYTKQLVDMAALRQSLLQAAFSGQLS